MTGERERSGAMRVEVVSGPVRYRLVPLMVLLAAMLVPVAGLAALALWSDHQADAYEAVDGGESDGVPSGPSVVPPPTPVLATPMFAFRRTPTHLAAEGADNRLATSMDQLYSYLDGRSCAVISVDGRWASVRNESTPVIPASTHKLLVAAVAIDRLGADYRYTTEVRGPAVVDGQIDGDVYLVGGGDPLLTSDDFPIDADSQPAFDTTSLDELADAIAATGVTRISGAVLGDGSRFDDEWEIPSWGDGVAGVEAGPYDALMVNDARVRGRSGRQSDPNLAAAREFVRLLNNRGVSVSQGWDTGTAGDGLGVLASVQSVPMESVVREMLITSDDDTAEMLLKELGVADSGEGTVAGGLNVVDATLRGWGLPMDGVRLVDASGLSSENRLTCAFLVALLDRLAGSPLADSLPVAGRTGTLTAEFIGSEVEGALTAKTGSLGNPPTGFDPPAVKGLAGYLDAADGSSIRFALILNGDGVNDPEVYRAFWDALALRLAAYPTGPDVATLSPR